MKLSARLLIYNFQFIERDKSGFVGMVNPNFPHYEETNRIKFQR